jgi:hypothetical protein
VDEIVSTFLDIAEQTGRVVRRRMGTVTDATVFPPLIDCGGGGVPTPVVGHYVPILNDQVVCIEDWDGKFTGSRLCLGRIGPQFFHMTGTHQDMPNEVGTTLDISSGSVWTNSPDWRSGDTIILPVDAFWDFDLFIDPAVNIPADGRFIGGIVRNSDGLVFGQNYNTTRVTTSAMACTTHGAGFFAAGTAIRFTGLHSAGVAADIIYRIAVQAR